MLHCFTLSPFSVVETTVVVYEFFSFFSWRLVLYLEKQHRFFTFCILLWALPIRTKSIFQLAHSSYCCTLQWTDVELSFTPNHSSCNKIKHANRDILHDMCVRTSNIKEANTSWMCGSNSRTDNEKTFALLRGNTPSYHKYFIGNVSELAWVEGDRSRCHFRAADSTPWAWNHPMSLVRNNWFSRCLSSTATYPDDFIIITQSRVATNVCSPGQFVLSHCCVTCEAFDRTLLACVKVHLRKATTASLHITVKPGYSRSN